jgi:hypothetical protein
MVFAIRVESLEPVADPKGLGFELVGRNLARVGDGDAVGVAESSIELLFVT